MLRDLNLKAVYDSSKYHLVKDLMVPLMKESIRYDRGVGYFTSGWLREASRGMVDLIENGGVARIVMSPIISKEDWEAMQKGDAAKRNKILHKILSREVDDLGKIMEEEPLNALAWLIADGLLEIKFAIPQGKLSGGDFHDKFAVFEDASGDKVAIHGSYNDSIHGTLNGESFSVFKIWEQGQEEYVETHEERFIQLWHQENEMFEICDIPKAIVNQIIKYRKKTRPYSQKKARNTSNIEQNNSDIVLRDYQEEAISSWIENEGKGIFEMATGTGKTITAINCAKRKFEESSKLALLVVVPYLHLITQWKKDLIRYGFLPILCSSDNANWGRQLSLKMQDYNLGLIEKFCVIVSHATAATTHFQGLINNIKGNNTMAIFDETHGLGSEKLRNALSDSFDYRLGLSATPNRWYDPSGSNVLTEYFNKICFIFNLEDAINRGYLVEYKYYPHIAEMSEEEYDEYKRLTNLISRLAGQKNEVEIDSRVESLLRKRAKIISNVEQKRILLRNLLQKEIEESKIKGENFSKTLVYCPPGEHRDVLSLVAELGIRAREFVYEVSGSDRAEILLEFARGDVQVIVAVKCLDEGVDVPATEKAFILASTTNPREFIQRRGRILRKSEGKEEAIIHDFIVIPPLSNQSVDANDEVKKGILRREMPRFAEFSSLAKNEFEARSKIKGILDKFYLSHLMNLKPWDIYFQNKPEEKYDCED